MNQNLGEELKKRYENIALSLDYNTTASDFQLRELEIDTASEYMYDGCKVLDVGCGLGYAVSQYASRHNIEAYGLDYAKNMVKGAEALLDKNYPLLKERVKFKEGSVTALPFDDGAFDVVTSSRCLMALLDWEMQKVALRELHRVLKPGGVLVLMEGTHDGLKKLNEVRQEFDLAEIEADGKDRLFTLKFNERELLKFCNPLFVLEKTKRFGMYYFLARVVHPLLVSPDAPRYDHKINEIARKMSVAFPDFDGMGHLVAFVLTKRR